MQKLRSPSQRSSASTRARTSGARAPLVGVGVLARDDVRQQPGAAVADDQRHAGEGRGAAAPQAVQAMVGAGQEVAVEGPQAQALDGSVGRGAGEGRDGLGHRAGRLGDQGLRDPGPQAVELVVNGGDGDRDGLGLLVGRVDGGVGAEDDLGHQPGQGAEGELPGVLGAGVSLEDVVQGGVAEGPGEGGPDHDGYGSPIEKPLKDLVHHRVLASWEYGTPRIARS